jgi:ubiquitin-conjugating enzyme E2 O
VPESDLLLLGRNLLPGNLVKRSLSSPQTAIVLFTRTEALLGNSLNDEVRNDWIPMEKLTVAARFRPGDRVIAGEWVGVVTMIAQIGYVVNEKTGRVYYLCDTMGAFDIGTKVSVSRPVSPRNTIPLYH